MNQGFAIAPSYALTTALVEFRRFLIDDEFERSDLLETTDWQSLVDLVQAVMPLFPEINGLLERISALPRPLPDELEVLEYDLKSLGQAGMEAQLVLRERGGVY